MIESQCVPVTFSGCFGYLHPAARKHGVVICAAVGHEALNTSRGVRFLAERFAELGFPVLRFDYSGSGDSISTDWKQPQLGRWVDDAVLAARWMRKHAGVERVSLCGLRLGANVAALAAQRLKTVDVLIQLAPVISGSSYIRELRGHSKMWWRLSAPEVTIVSQTRDWIDLGGHKIGADTIDEIQRLDSHDSQVFSGGRTLVVSSSSDQAYQRYIASLKQTSANVDEQPFEGFDAYLRDAVVSRVPVVTFERVAHWFDDQVTAESRPHSPRTDTPALPYFEPLTSIGPAVETPVRFGDEKLFGIVCEPRESHTRNTALLILNTGANPHVGVARFSVLLARQLAGAGFSSMRIDISGLGESGELGAEVTQRSMYSDDACADASCAVDYLVEQGYRLIVVLGVCSGATIALHSTRFRHEEIKGLILVNMQKWFLDEGTTKGLAVRTTARSLPYYARSTMRLHTWHRLLRGDAPIFNVARVIAGRTSRLAWRRLRERMDALRGRETVNEAQSWMRNLSARGVRVSLVYAEGDAALEELNLHCDQHGDALSQLPSVSIEIKRNADHIFAAEEARTWLAAYTLAFMKSVAQ